jgi:hypothetical protein
MPRPENWPYLFDASRLEFRVAKHRSEFLLRVHSQGNPSIDIRFPLSYGPELLAQVQNMVATGQTDFDPNPRGDPKAN